MTDYTYMVIAQRECPKCEGEGVIDEYDCLWCGGVGVERREVPLEKALREGAFEALIAGAERAAAVLQGQDRYSKYHDPPPERS